MSKYGYLEVFQRVPSTSRKRESTVFYFIIFFKFCDHAQIGKIPHLAEFLSIVERCNIRALGQQCLCIIFY